jgi:hypothetical protein
MVRRTLISVVETPDISNISNFVVTASEELLEVFCGLNQLWQPDQSWEISLSAWNVSSSKVN